MLARVVIVVVLLGCLTVVADTTFGAPAVGQSVRKAHRPASQSRRHFWASDHGRPGPARPCPQAVQSEDDDDDDPSRHHTSADVIVPTAEAEDIEGHSSETPLTRQCPFKVPLYLRIQALLL